MSSPADLCEKVHSLDRDVHKRKGRNVVLPLADNHGKEGLHEEPKKCLPGRLSITHSTQKTTRKLLSLITLTKY